MRNTPIGLDSDRWIPQSRCRGVAPPLRGIHRSESSPKGSFAIEPMSWMISLTLIFTQLNLEPTRGSQNAKETMHMGFYYTLSLSSLWRRVWQSVKSASKIKSILDYLSCTIWGSVYSAAGPFRMWWMWKYFCFILLSSSNGKYVWPICHCVGLGHGKMLCTISVAIFLFFLLNFNKWLCHNKCPIGHLPFVSSWKNSNRLQWGS